MKRLCSLTLALMLTLSLAACGGTSGSQADTPAPAEPSDASIELIVYAAASMTETLQEIAGLYAEAAPNVTLTFNFDSSGTLKTQIQEGADCDLFISAGQKQMDQLDIASSPEVNTEGLDFVMTAMFTVIFLNQWEKDRQHYSALIGLAAPLACLVFFGSGSFLLPSMGCILILLLALRKPIEKAEGTEAEKSGEEVGA